MSESKSIRMEDAVGFMDENQNIVSCDYWNPGRKTDDFSCD